jgi:hypothetical protein
VVERGDLIQVSIWLWSNKENKRIQRNDDWWIRIGFRAEKEASSYSVCHEFISAFVGLKKGDGIKFLESLTKGSLSVRRLYLNPFEITSWPCDKKFTDVNVPTSSGHTVVHINNPEPIENPHRLKRAKRTPTRVVEQTGANAGARRADDIRPCETHHAMIEKHGGRKCCVSLCLPQPIIRH